MLLGIGSIWTIHSAVCSHITLFFCSSVELKHRGCSSIYHEISRVCQFSNTKRTTWLYALLRTRTVTLNSATENPIWYWNENLTEKGKKLWCVFIEFGCTHNLHIKQKKSYNLFFYLWAVHYRLIMHIALLTVTLCHASFTQSFITLCYCLVGLMLSSAQCVLCVTCLVLTREDCFLVWGVYRCVCVWHG